MINEQTHWKLVFLMFPIDARPISRLDAAVAVAGAPAIYHLQALTQHFLHTSTRNTLSKGKKYTYQKGRNTKMRKFTYHLQALSQHFLPKRTRNKLSKGKKYLFHFTIRGWSMTIMKFTVYVNMQSLPISFWKHLHPKSSVLEDTMFSWAYKRQTIEAKQALEWKIWCSPNVNNY